MKVRLQAPLFVLGKPTQQAKKDQTVTYYYVTASQGEEEAGKIRIADVEVYNRVEKYKQQLFTFEFNDQYNSFAIVDVAPMPDVGKTDSTPTTTPDAGKADAGKTDSTPTTTPDAGKADAGKTDKKH